MIEYASDRMTTVVLTNAMLFTGRRRAELARLARRPNLTLQSSIDGARAETHDRWRGAGSWAKAIDGLRYAADLGLAAARRDDGDARQRATRSTSCATRCRRSASPATTSPCARSCSAASRPMPRTAGAIEVSDAVMVPELTITADGAHWHPVGGDVDSSPDFLVARGDVSLAEAKRRIVERFLVLRQSDGSLPHAFHCAV